MRIPVTDKFLWDAYKFLEKAGNVSGFLIKTDLRLRNLLPGEENPVYKKYRRDKNAREFGKLIYYLKRNGYIKVKNLENKKAIMLTKEGIDKAIKAGFKIDRPVRKDKKWAMIIFDIPQKHKGARDLMRSILNNLGYKMFQKSVWISPYDVSERTEKLLQTHLLDSYVKIFLIEEI